MGLEIIGRELNGLILFRPKVFEDERGFFLESYRQDEFEKLGLPTGFVQDNHSRSVFGVLRGMHFQWDKPMGKLIRVTVGSAFVAEVDIRPGSPTFGQWFGTEISADNKHILWVPPGFANGFCSISDTMEMQYKCTAVWNKDAESAISYNDPDIGIQWPVANPVLSEKDRNAQSLSEWISRHEAEAFRY